MRKVQIYDTTLRDGAQREGISFSVVDKLNIARKLDELGVDFIEGGWPGSNPKDRAFFRQARNLKFSKAKLVAFGSTRRAGDKSTTSPNLRSLVNSGAKVVTIVGKSSEAHVRQVLETSLRENLEMIRDSIEFLVRKKLTVFFDAEHFFDGFKSNPQYSVECLRVAQEAGASCLVLCDTNGGSLPKEISDAVVAVMQALKKTTIGIHAHNDGELAVANSLAAINAGANQVQGTINGYGERCGNANLCSIIADLRLKMGINCLTNRRLTKLTDVARFVSETANLAPDPFQPYVGASAFTHKAGLHVQGLNKWAGSYQHIEPALVGNRQRSVVSELSGRGNIIYKSKELGIRLPPNGQEAKNILKLVKRQESRGFQYENAEASLELLFRRALPAYKPPFQLVDLMVIVESGRRTPTQDNHDEMLAEAMIKVKIGSDIIHTAAEGNGPVNALDQALRKALVQFYPKVADVQLRDYKVRILEESTGTGSQVRVLIESSDGVKEWHTVGSSTNIIEASWLALVDSLEYWLTKQKTSGKSSKK